MKWPPSGASLYCQRVEKVRSSKPEKPNPDPEKPNPDPEKPKILQPEKPTELNP
jgi:hypothetical protein